MTATVLPLRAQSPYGSWVLAPEVAVPGTPRAELVVNGEPMLLLEGLHSNSSIDAILWNPTTTIPLEPPSSISVLRLDDFLGVPGVNPRVYLRGQFVVSGVVTAIVQWTPSGWGFAGGPISGEIRAWALRSTPAGPELWVGGEALSAGLASESPLLRFDGMTWEDGGLAAGSVDDLLTHDEGLSSGEVITVAGEITEFFGGPALPVMRYADGNWDSLSEGLSVENPSLSLLEISPGQHELWVSGRIAGTPPTAPWSVRRYRGGVWDLIPGLPALEQNPGSFVRLPTIYGDWCVAEYPVRWSGQPESPLAFDPNFEIWAEVLTPAVGAYRFESAASLFPEGIFQRSLAAERRRWEVSTVEFIRGDASNDGYFDIADPIALLEKLFGSDRDETPCWEASDANDDGSVNISDAVLMLLRLFSPAGTIPIPAPHPHCGLDLDLDFLTCQDHGFCL